MNKRDILTLAEEIIGGGTPDNKRYRELLATPDNEIFGMLCGADMVRDYYFGREIHLCTICNGKSGRCSEDCGFCSQSVFARTDAPVYPLMEKEGLIEGGLHASETVVNRYSIVTTGKRLPRKEVRAVADAMAELDSRKVGKCVSLGTLESEDFQILKEAGVSRYHHNLETSRTYFSKICSSHTYEERVNTIIAAKEAGLSVCSGGIFGVGEGDDHIFELALYLRKLDVDSVPINFFSPIKGTALESFHRLTPLGCLKIIAFFRFFLPDKEIIICGGREANLGELHPLIFYAGASGIMTGNYLTTEGRTLEKDLETIDHLGFTIREKELSVNCSRQDIA